MHTAMLVLLCRATVWSVTVNIPYWRVKVKKIKKKVPCGVREPISLCQYVDVGSLGISACITARINMEECMNEKKRKPGKRSNALKTYWP